MEVESVDARSSSEDRDKENPQGSKPNGSNETLDVDTGNSDPLNVSKTTQQEKIDSNQESINQRLDELLARLPSTSKSAQPKDSGGSIKCAQIDNLPLFGSISPGWTQHQLNRVPKLDFPRFDGDNPRGWIQKCERYFWLHNIVESHRVDIAAIYLDGKADKWFLNFQVGRNRITWFEFAHGICIIFENPVEENFIGSFNNLVQINSVEEYFEEFESLKALILSNNPSLSEHYFIMSFISGLKEELGNSVAMFYPKSLSTAFSLARMEEQKCHSAASKNVRPKSSSFTDTKSFSTTTFPPKPISTSYTTSRSTPTTPKSYSPTPLKPASTTPIIKRLTQEQMRLRREKGICYNCDEFYSLGHKCKGRQQLFMLQTESSDTHNTEVEDEVFEEVVESSVDSDMEISLHAPLGYQFYEDFRLLPLGGFDMVLGADWLRKLGDVVFNFSKLSVSFVHHGKHIKLQGITNSPSLLMMSGSAVKRFIEKTTHGLIGHLFSVTTNHIPPPTPAPLLPLLSEYKDIFDEPTSLPPQRTLDHSIPLNPDSQPTNQRPYRCPYIQKGVVEQLVKEMLSSGIIQHSHIPFASPILLVKRKDNTWRFCVDYRRLSSITIKDKFPIPIVDELLDELKGFLFLSKLDLRSGYHQILLNPMDIYKTAFRTHHGHYEFKVMSFCLTNAHATFQELMNEVFAPYLRKFVLVFFDDILVYSSSMSENIEHLRIVFSLLRQHWKFVKNYGAICKPLTDLLTKNSFNWNAVATSAFEQLKLSMSSTSVLALPDFSKPFTVESDASEHCLGVVLTQEVKAVQKWRHYLLGNKFFIQTDHRSIKYFLEQKITTVLQQKWLMKLLGFEYEIQYKKGKENIVADALSRIPAPAATCSALTMSQPN
ncbi:uncharacterized protein LOC113273010 [Papaver somniferum]|uniref:uncharacterized protein LOC113273010 n=1 Tax=Papaver somniferum TaxID=3469 RepID=UPI000E6FB0F3|nr:uncharacterized protein LOC113273010 [Papaver somniferum]